MRPRNIDTRRQIIEQQMLDARELVRDCNRRELYDEALAVQHLLIAVRNVLDAIEEADPDWLDEPLSVRVDVAGAPE